MKTLLIPVDFTDTTDNAVSFGAEWCKKYAYERIILLRSFYDTVFDTIVPSAEYSAVSSDYRLKEREEAEEKLGAISRRLRSLLPTGILLESIISEVNLLRAILEVTEEEKVDMVVLGSDNYNHANGSFVAGNVIRIAKASPVRVLIVPASYQYQPVQAALVPFDFNKVDSLIRLYDYSNSPFRANTKLLILNVDPNGRHLDKDGKFVEAEEKLNRYLASFNHEISYSSDKDVINGIFDFIQSNPVQLIIALPGQHSFLYALTHKSISEAIYRNAKEPVMILK